MTAPPRLWAELWRYWLAMPPTESQAVWDALPPSDKERARYWLGKTFSTRPDSPANAEAIRRCLDALPPSALIQALEAAVVAGALARKIATGVEEKLLGGISRDGAWL